MLSSVVRKESRSWATRTLRSRSWHQPAWRALSTASSDQPSTTSPGPSSVPWFIDPSEPESSTPSPYSRRVSVPQAPALPLPPLPSALPQNHPIVRLHEELKSSPHLEPGTLLVREPIPTAVGPPLPEAMPRGRRKRGRTNLGEGVSDDVGGIWDWLVIAQVKEGTENRGAIESVIRIVRKALLTGNPPLPLPPNNKRRVNGAWAMIDAGDFAVHILSKEAREKYFPDQRDW
ncbi:hypothetical protein L226DRAFT_465399 [Lentinus tigrinus ALCF2SS1-7]|uniref:Uncharacterized protein n=1 Tax=Lentinus tigrinus ALCF2SS1-6 TaxID=1328759 RepID=A0A5C2S7T8_9APHY|nr:hypothetical protein L227DRAFT_503834 [Lentinus tigrinus ALCF2SS1-6]RPD73474.1 hypothetical protein L226DRAFT_465399 [Lentinus tigrinus ALCF2SS1-7]